MIIILFYILILTHKYPEGSLSKVLPSYLINKIIYLEMNSLVVA